MPKANRVIVTMGIAVLLLFAGGVLHLFLLRFEAGDIYPPYSSLRSDPLGTRALFESLARMPGRTVARHLEDPEKLPSPKGTTLILAGLDAFGPAGSERGTKALKRFVVGGGRVVLMLAAVKPNTGTEDACPTGNAGKTAKGLPAGGDAEAPPSETRRPDLETRWGYGLETPEMETIRRMARRDPAANVDLPETIAWHSGMTIIPEHPAWQILYRVDGRPVVMERRLGKGSIFMGTDSYLLSNEALRSHRQPALLGRMVGPRRRVVFDETHFGIHRRLGVSDLVRRYRLHGLITGLILLAGLYIWRNSRPFLPAAPERVNGGVRFGSQDANRALAGLIGRHVPDDRLLATCVAEYEKSLGRPAADAADKLVQIKQLAAQAGQDPVQPYQTICQVLARRISQ